MRIVALCGALAACACSSDGTSSGGTAGAPGAAGAGATAGASATGGSGGTPGGAGAGTAGAGTAGAPSAGAGGAAAGAAGAGTAGSAGSSAAGAGGAGTGGSGGSGGAAAGSGGMGGGTTTDCAGHAVSLSGNSASDSAAAHVDIDLMSDLPIGNTTRTVEVWAYMKTSDWQANSNTLFYYGDNVDRAHAPAFGLDFGSTSGGIGSIDPFTNGVFDNDNQASGIMVSMSQWVHFAMTWDGTAVKAFVNGVQKASIAGSGGVTMLKTAQSHFTLGGYPAPENAYFPDYVDELRIWNVARSASDILANMKKGLVGNEAGLVGYWKFNESSGTTAMDSVTTAGHTAHNGTLMAAMAANVPTFVVPTPPSPVMCP